MYIVGGCVRDALLGIPASDTDYVAVGYTKEDFSHLQMVGQSFPVFLDEDGNEIALARLERSTGEGYGDFSVEVDNVTLESDLLRRDFSINSIAVKDGEYIDPYKGIEDINNKILRHTSEAFTEDPVRVLRLARLRCKLPGFWKIHPSTKVLIYSMREQLKSLQPDRVWKEVEKALKTDRCWIFFETLFELGVLDVIFPSIYQMALVKEGSQWHQEASVFDHTMRMLKEVPTASVLTKISIVYHDIAKPAVYRVSGHGGGHDDMVLISLTIDMKIPVKLRADMLTLIGAHIRIARLDEMTPSKVLKTLSPFMKLKQPLLNNCEELYHADINGRIAIGERTTEDPDFNLIRRMVRELSEYSPMAWLELFDEKPKGTVIMQHVHREKLNIIKRIRNEI